MPDLFGIALQGIVSSAAGWAAKKFLDAITNCPLCGSTDERTIGNGASSSLTCRSCCNSLDQYMIATPTTVRDGRLMGANIFNPHWESQIQKSWFTRARLQKNWFLFDVCSVGMQHNGMVVKAAARDVVTGKTYPCGDMYLNNDRERTTYQRVGWGFEPYALPAGPIVMDVSVLTLNGDKLQAWLHSLISPPTPSDLSHDCDLTRCCLRCSPQHCAMSSRA